MKAKILVSGLAAAVGAVIGFGVVGFIGYRSEAATHPPRTYTVFGEQRIVPAWSLFVHQGEIHVKRPHAQARCLKWCSTNKFCHQY